MHHGVVWNSCHVTWDPVPCLFVFHRGWQGLGLWCESMVMSTLRYHWLSYIASVSGWGEGTRKKNTFKQKSEIDSQEISYIQEVVSTSQLQFLYPIKWQNINGVSPNSRLFPLLLQNNQSAIRSSMTRHNLRAFFRVFKHMHNRSTLWTTNQKTANVYRKQENRS